MKIAGRYFCGFAMELVAKKPDPHLRCYGLRWCGVCGEAARFRKDCTRCSNRRSIESRRRCGRSERVRASNRRASREYQRRQRRAGTAVYERDKERKRLKYRTDAAWAAKKRADVMRRHWARQQQAAA